MRKNSLLASAASLSLIIAHASSALGAPTLRYTVDQKGDFILIGNTLGVDCASGAVAKLAVGSAEATAACAAVTNGGDSAPDLYVRSDDPVPSSVAINASITPLNARSTAVLRSGPGGGTSLPSDAVISYARLYWAASVAEGASVDPAVTFERVGAGGFSASVTSDGSYSALPFGAGGGIGWYEQSADVTALVKAGGIGAYRVSHVDSRSVVDADNSIAFGAWSMVIIYRRAADPVRNLSVFDGLDVIGPTNVNTQLSGFLVPPSGNGFDGKLGVVAYEGDGTIPGDRLLFGPTGRALTNADALSDALNPADNFFNGTRSALGIAVSNAGDLPQPDGTINSMSGIDLDIVDIKPRLTNGQTSAQLSAISTGDYFGLGAFVTSISTLNPEFSDTTKKVKNLTSHPGGALLPGDVLEYTITLTNRGTDKSVKTRVVDDLPADVSFVPGSIDVITGSGAGLKTDVALDDQGEYAAATRQVIVRVGTGANGTEGGTLAIGEGVSLKFKVKLNAAAAGLTKNLARVEAFGDTALTQGASAPKVWGSSENGDAPGQPTTSRIDQCAESKDCAPQPALCDTSMGHPFVCKVCIAGDTCDADSDGISDGEERTLGTDPNKVKQSTRMAMASSTRLTKTATMIACRM
jgi:clumping factor A